MTSGSDLGVPQTFGTACQLATKLEAKYRPRKILDNALYSPLALILSLFQTHRTYLAPATGECTVFKLSSDFGSDQTKKIYAPGWCNTSLDMVQGGHVPVFKIYRDEINGQRPKKWYKNFVKLFVDDYMGSQTQQLTYSTLGIGLGNLPDLTRKWDANFRIDKFNQPCDETCPETKESPFDMYWSPDINTRHDSLLLGHVIRLRKEIIDKQLWQKTQLQRQATITGNKILLCAGEIATYSVTNPLTNMIYNWTPSSTFLQVISGQGTPSVTIQHNGPSTYQGNYTINCTASSACYNINIPDKTIYVGKQLIRGWYNSPTNSSQPMASSGRFEFNWNDVCYGEYINASMDVWPGTTMTWEDAGNSGGVTWWQNGNNLQFYFSGPDQYAYFRAYATNACGTNNALFRFRSVEGECGGPPLRMSIAPNPANDKAEVFLFENNDKYRKKEIFEIRVMDKIGNVIRREKYSKGTKSVVLDVSELKTDVYLIMVFDGIKWTSGKFIKQ